MESKEKKSEKPEIREMLQHWATTTTAHGVSRIAAASRPPEKLYWIAIWCTVMVFFVFLSVKLILLYQRKPVSTKVELWYERVRAIILFCLSCV